ncbi:hypothetical protein OAB00_02485 [Akkermansiaceae bacterium]|nr:hypothetical protein [Akkermansiaceae bacterium]
MKWKYLKNAPPSQFYDLKQELSQTVNLSNKVTERMKKFTTLLEKLKTSSNDH